MSGKSQEQLGGKFEKSFEAPKKSQTSEALRGAFQQQCAYTLTDYNALLHSDEREGYEALFGAAMLICSLLRDDAPEFDAEDKKEKEGDGKSSSKSTSPTKAKEKKKENEKKVKEIAKKLEEKKQKLKKSKEASPAPWKSKEKFQPSNIFYVGDSYMGGITRKRVRQNTYAKGSRPFVAFGKKAKELWGGNDVETVANKALNNPNCKLLVLAGGLNDFFSYGNPQKTYKRVREAYQRIINRAKEKGIKLVIYKVPKINKVPVERKTGKKRYEKKERINMYTDMLNGWLDEEYVFSDMDLIDTNKAIGNNWGDSIHPNRKGYANLYDEIKNNIA